MESATKKKVLGGVLDCAMMTAAAVFVLSFLSLMVLLFRAVLVAPLDQLCDNARRGRGDDDQRGAGRDAGREQHRLLHVDPGRTDRDPPRLVMLRDRRHQGLGHDQRDAPADLRPALDRCG